MRGVNKVILVGNLGNDPETRVWPDGGCTTMISVATSETWKDRQTGAPMEKTEWHRIVFNGRLAEIARDYLRKGSKVYVEGSLTTRKWQDKNTGQDRYSTEIKARELQMLDSKQDNNAGFQQNQGGYQQQPSHPPQNNHQSAPQSTQGQNFDDFDDDIPY